MSTFRKAQRSQAFIKLAITGPTGSGKTYSALRLAKGLVADSGKRIAFIDTENNSASLYSDSFDFDTLNISAPYEAEKFGDAIKAAVASAYGVAVIDSASHFWKGILAYKDAMDSRGGNSFTNWKGADAKFDPVIAEILHSQIHLIVCLRSKMDYVLEDNGKGKQAPKKVGLAPIMRDGIEYEFTTVFDLAMDHTASPSKDRSGLFDGKFFTITEDTGKTIASWLSTATPEPLNTVTYTGKRVESVETFTRPDDVVDGKIVKRGYTRHGITLDGGYKCGTYDTTLSTAATILKENGKPCDIVVQTGSKEGTFDLVSITEHDEVPV